MPYCQVCHKTGSKGFYSLKAVWKSVLNLPPELEIKRSSLVCFRHFKVDDFWFVGNQMRLKKDVTPVPDIVTSEIPTGPNPEVVENPQEITWNQLQLPNRAFL